MPLGDWPALSPDHSHQLTLVTTAAVLGVVGVARENQERLPTWIVGWALSLLSLMAWHHRRLFLEGGYFDHFPSVAWLSEGALLLLAVLWGAWALRQMPVRWMRQLRWVGAGIVLSNLAMGLWQLHQMGGWLPGSTSVTGWMGLDRFLGATAVTWTPILLSWHWAWGIPCVVLVLLSGKVTAWIGLAVVWWCLYRPTHRLVQGAGLLVVLLIVGLLTVGQLPLQVDQRLLTWTHTIHASLAHPFVGWGFGPRSEQAIAGYGYVLPSIHSDWLSLAFHGGWPITILAGIGLWRWLAPVRVRPMACALRASLIAAVVMTGGQSLIGHARMLSLWVLLAVWLLKEERNGAPDALSPVAEPGAVGGPVGAPSLG